ncbi:MAG: hypothetical protein LBC18_14735 [Opitutaceae bacterium]|jgi:hypothetical protein|nr:hypothetical protein [Opitutaceae bacterium]
MGCKPAWSGGPGFMNGTEPSARLPPARTPFSVAHFLLPLFPSGTDIPAPPTVPSLLPAPQKWSELQPHAAKSQETSKTIATIFFMMPAKKTKPAPPFQPNRTFRNNIVLP